MRDCAGQAVYVLLALYIVVQGGSVQDVRTHLRAEHFGVQAPLRTDSFFSLQEGLVLVPLAAGSHLFPSRTQQLSPPALYQMLAALASVTGQAPTASRTRTRATRSMQGKSVPRPSFFAYMHSGGGCCSSGQCALVYVQSVSQYFWLPARNRAIGLRSGVVEYGQYQSGMQVPRLTSMALGIGIIALSALGTIAWKNAGNLWKAQIQPIQNCQNTIIVCGGFAQDVRMTGPNCDIIPPCPEFCGNGIVDEREQCGEPTLSCASNQECVGCVCIPLTRVCGAVLTCADGTTLSPRPFCEFDRCPRCGNWTLDPGEGCEVGVCCPAGQACNVYTCMCGPFLGP